MKLVAISVGVGFLVVFLTLPFVSGSMHNPSSVEADQVGNIIGSIFDYWKDVALTAFRR